jgi:elongation factor Ts
MDISAEMVKELRDRTGAGMMQCKKALAETGGDMEKATDALRRMGLASAAKRADRTAAEGRIEAYIHPGNRIGVLVEVNCETDFVARTDDFAKLCREIALQVAATAPTYVRVEDVADELMEKERQEARKRLSEEGVSASDLEGRLKKEIDRFLEERCLLNQPNIRDGARTIGELVTEAAAKMGENIRVSRFCYFRLGENQ